MLAQSKSRKPALQPCKVQRWLLAPQYKETLTMVKLSYQTDSFCTDQKGYEQAWEEAV